MTKRAFLSALKFQLPKLKGLCIGIVAYVVIMHLMTALITFMEYGEAEFDGMSSMGMELFAIWVSFCFAAGRTYDSYNTACACGISRITTIAANAATAVVTGFAISAIVSVLYPFIALITGNEEMWLMEYIYGTRWDMTLHGYSEIIWRLEFFVLIAAITTAAHMAGVFAGSVFYRLNKMWTYIVIFGTLAVIFGIPMYFAYLEMQGIDTFAIMKESSIPFRMIFGCAYVNGRLLPNIPLAVVMYLALAALFTLLSWVFARRAGVKPLAIRNE